ncbi:MAG: hypothetical protein EOP11_09880 [Proteobacteria bacterium]|nr:MAG: hypothetical protein EOP11_09880 [Pseudomonadota bacterium]
MKHLFLLIALIACATPSFAADKVLNGGDACERRFTEVRDDLRTWLENGGSKALVFPEGKDKSGYATAMLRAIGQAQVACTADKLWVGTAEKVCVNETDLAGDSRILCQRDAYLSLGVNEQYRLTHHEYAGITGYETNKGDASTYSLSDQLTGYLDFYSTQRLTVKSDKKAGDAIERNFKDFYGTYEIAGCSTSSDFPEGTRDIRLCDIAVIKIERQDMLFGQPGSSLLATPVWLKKPDVKGGIILGYSRCQLGYGTIDCTPQSYPGPDLTQKVFYSTRIVKAGDTTFLDINIEDTREAATHFEKFALVLKPYHGALPEKK